MYTDKVIEAEHLDLIHDVAYDFHGRRMATCSSDQTVKVKVSAKYILSLSTSISFLDMGFGGWRMEVYSELENS